MKLLTTNLSPEAAAEILDIQELQTFLRNNHFVCDESIDITARVPMLIAQTFSELRRRRSKRIIVIQQPSDFLPQDK